MSVIRRGKSDFKFFVASLILGPLNEEIETEYA
jgi:hypothetical protein